MSTALEHTISGLIAKRAEIAAQIEHAQDKFGKLVIELHHIDASIHIAIHVRLKGEMSEACLALEPKGWAYASP
jgi:hypothetical protein